MQHWYDKHGIPFRSRLIAYITSVNKLGSIFPAIFNFFLKNKFISSVFKRAIGFAKERSILLYIRLLCRRWAKKEP